MKSWTIGIADMLNENANRLAGSIAAVGFDGFVDTLFRVIKHKNPDGNHVFFKSINEYGKELMAGRNSSRSFELMELATKIGGNMPILGNAFGCLGIATHCLGSLGVPTIHPVFTAMSPHCTLHSFGRPGSTTALEFSDGKIMLAQMDSLHEITWASIVQNMKVSTLKDIYRQADIIGLVNWAEIDSSGSIWRGLLEEVLQELGARQDRLIFFDLADCSKRRPAEIVTALRMVQKFRDHGRAILSLNESEARLVSGASLDCDPLAPLQALGRTLFRWLDIDHLVIHSSRHAWGWSRHGEEDIGTWFVTDPRMTTGGGDNFNARFRHRDSSRRGSALGPGDWKRHVQLLREPGAEPHPRRDYRVSRGAWRRQRGRGEMRKGVWGV